MADKKLDEPIIDEPIIDEPIAALRLATPAEQVAFNEARRAAARAGLPPPDPPTGILFDMNLPD